jgi:hypothetical protein
VSDQLTQRLHAEAEQLPRSGLLPAEVRQRAEHRRRIHRSVALAAAAGIAIAVLAGATIGNPFHQAPPPVITPPHPAPSVALWPCEASPPMVTCVNTTRFRVALPVPFTVELPRTFSKRISVEPAPGFVTAVLARPALAAQQFSPHSGEVQVLERVVVVRVDRHRTPDGLPLLSPDPTVIDTPAAVFQWLTSRPYLYVYDSAVTTVAGYQAYEIEFGANGSGPAGVRLGSGGSPMPIFGVARAHVPFYDTPKAVGIQNGVVVRCWLISVPGGGLTVIWSDVNNAQGLQTPANLSKNQQLVDSLRFEP